MEILCLVTSIIVFVIQPSHSVDYSPPPMVLMEASPLNQDHLVIIVTEYPVSLKIQRNATGYLVDMEGVSPNILDWLSHRYKFNSNYQDFVPCNSHTMQLYYSYSILDINAPPRPIQTLEDGGPNKPGVISYAVRGECDVIISVIQPTPVRSQRLNFVHPWLYTPIAFIIPMPEVSKNNIDAVIKPFQFWVWLALMIATASVIVTLSCFNRFLKTNSLLPQNAENSTDVGVTENICIYVLGTLLNQGGYISNKFTPIRMVVGAWCFLILVLLNVYNGTLISYVMQTGRALPLLTSFEDAAESNVLLVVNKGLGPDIFLSTAESKFYKMLGDKLRAHSKSRCNSTRQCVEHVKSLPPQYAFLDGEVTLKAAIQEDYRRTGQCKLTIAAKIDIGNLGYGWGMAKTSRYREKFNQGTLRLHEMGLISLWKTWFEPNARPCLNDINDNRNVKKKEKKQLTRISLANLTGAFVVLAVGCMISVFVFLMEKVVARWKINHITVL